VEGREQVTPLSFGQTKDVEKRHPMKKLFVYLFCLLTASAFSTSVAWGYSPPSLTYGGYTGGPFVTTPNLVGQCTWYCYGRIQEVGLKTASQLASLPNRNGGTGIFLGDASTWIADATAAGFTTGSTPQVGALAVWGSANHVAFVETVSGSTFQVTECNNTPIAGVNIVVGATSARLRSSMDASSTANILWTMPQFTIMNVLSGPSAVVNGYQWIQITGNGYTGYVAWLDLSPSRPATPTSLQWNITRFKNSASSPMITSTSPTFIYITPPPCVDDAYEPDDTAGAAKTITDNETQNRTICLGNEDWASFTVGAANSGAVVRTDARAGFTGGDTEMWLYGPNSSTTQIGYNDDFTGLWSQITAANLAVGTYYVRVRELGNNAAIPGYTLYLDITPLQTGSLQVSLAPPGAVSAGAQ
jgi:surface antigen